MCNVIVLIQPFGCHTLIDDSRCGLQTLFVLNHYVSARDDHVFAEADRFIPERWLRADSSVDSEDSDSSSSSWTTDLTISDEHRQRRAFSCLPFGYGNRSCLGQFAMIP